jgi:hypothetical protein
MGEIKRYTLSELENLARKTSGTGKKVYIMENNVYKVSNETWHRGDYYYSEKEYTERILKLKDWDDLIDFDPPQLHFELWVWQNLNESEIDRDYFCPILDYYYSDNHLVCVMPKAQVFYELDEGYSNIEEIWDYSEYDLDVDNVEGFKNFINTLHDFLGFDLSELAYTANIGILDYKLVSIDYGR